MAIFCPFCILHTAYCIAAGSTQKLGGHHADCERPAEIVAPLMADAAPGSWPLELQELVSCPPVAEFLTSLGVDSLAAFAEIVDLEEGHDAQLRAAVEALSDKPKKNKQRKARARRTLTDLLAQQVIFEELDADGGGRLTKAEARGPAASRVAAIEGGGTLAQHFGRVCDRSGHVGFYAFIEHFALAETTVRIRPLLEAARPHRGSKRRRLPASGARYPYADWGDVGAVADAGTNRNVSPCWERGVSGCTLAGT